MALRPAVTQFSLRASTISRLRPGDRYLYLRGFSSSDVNDDEDDDNDINNNASKRTRVRQKTVTLDDFFENLGSTATARTDISSSARRRRIPKGTNNNVMDDVPKSSHKSSLADTLSNLQQSPPVSEGSSSLSEMNSFFDEINKVVAEKAKVESPKSAGPEPPVNQTPSQQPSILDLMSPIAKKRSDKAFDEDSYDQYMDLLESIFEDPRFLRRRDRKKATDEEIQAVFQWLRSEEPTVDYNFSVLEHMNNVENDIPWDNANTKMALKADLDSQREKFLACHGWNSCQQEIATRALYRMGDLCAKKASGAPAEVAWEKLKEASLFGTKSHHIIQTYLYIISTFSTTSYSSTFSSNISFMDFLDEKEEEDESSQDLEQRTKMDTVDEKDAAEEVAILHDILFGPSEQSTAIRVRKLVSQRRAAEAETLLDGNATDELRLRTYEPVFRCYLENKDIAAALKLFVKMKGGETVFLKAETYVQLIAGIAENGFFRANSPPIEGATELGYRYSSGPKLFDLLASELAENSVEISASSAKRLYNTLLSGSHGKAFKPLHPLQSLEVCNDEATPIELVASRVALDNKTGKCPRVGVQLRLINLNADQKQQLKKGLQFLAKSAYQERSGKDGTPAEKHLKDFGDWLINRKEKPFTAIIDGANVGYYFQNFDEGKFNYHQINFVAETLEDMGETVLVTMPKKYTQNSFTVMKSSGPRRQTLTQKEKAIRDRLVSTGKLLIVPPSYLDDYYWMYASVAGQGGKFTPDQQYIAPNDPDSRWPGIRPMLISNDKMRDHKLSLLEPRLFRRWYSNFLVNYTFSAFVGDEAPQKDIGFSTADFFSREIQGNKVLIDDKDLGTAWHFPVSDWDENECFCVRIPP